LYRSARSRIWGVAAAMRCPSVNRLPTRVVRPTPTE